MAWRSLFGVQKKNQVIKQNSQTGGYWAQKNLLDY